MEPTGELIATFTLLALFTLIGTISNALVICVFAKKKNRHTSTVFILTLAVVDMLTCFIVMPFTIYMEFRKRKVAHDFKLYLFLITSFAIFIFYDGDYFC